MKIKAVLKKYIILYGCFRDIPSEINKVTHFVLSALICYSDLILTALLCSENAKYGNLKFLLGKYAVYTLLYFYISSPSVNVLLRTEYLSSFLE